MEPFVKFRDLALHLTVNEELNALVVTDLNLAVGELLRMCNGDPEVVRSLIEFQTLETVIEICRCIAASKDSQQKYTSLDVEQDTAILKSFVVRSCRLTSNFTACGENARTYFFGMIIERASEKSFDHLSHLLSAALVVDGRNAVAAVVSAIYNCLQASTDADRETQQAACLRNEALCEARGLLCQLLLAVISTSKLSLPGGEGSPAPDQCAAADSPTADPALEWFHMLTFQWARTGLLSRIYSTVGSSRALQEDSKGGKSVVLTHEQVK